LDASRSEFSGGQRIMAKAPTDYIPVYIRKQSAHLRWLFMDVESKDNRYGK
jgi:alpha-glucosidase (family GH31 glycosyl hydrolase)